MKRNQTSDNCNGISPMSKMNFYQTLFDKVELWYQRLGHVNFKNLARISKDVVIGLSPLHRIKSNVCGSCLDGEWTKAHHWQSNEIHTTRPLELLHMDLMGSTQTESLGEKKYIFVIVYDLSIYTWIILLGKNLKFFILARSFLKDYKLKKNYQSLKSVVIMVESLKILYFHCFVMTWYPLGVFYTHHSTIK